jgi:hypothetical protein
MTNLNLANDIAYTVTKVVIGGMIIGGLVLGIAVSPWWLLLMPASVVALRVIVGPI